MADKLKFLKSAIRDMATGKKTKVHYSQGSYTKQSGLPKGTITVYAKNYGMQIPKQLKPINETDIQTDYFATDVARVKPSSKHFKAVSEALKKQKAWKDKVWNKRMEKYN